MKTSYHAEVRSQKIYGKVIYGFQKGRTIGFPTANLDCFVDWLENGVYGGLVNVRNRTYLGVMNIGVRPTFHDNAPKNVEVHILNFSDMIYGEIIEFKTLFKIREERKFNSIENLVFQIREDVSFTLEKFQSNRYLARYCG